MLDQTNGLAMEHTERKIDQLTKLNVSEATKILICTESFYPYTSGIARRFKEIIVRLAERGHLIHIITGCKGCETLTDDPKIQSRVSFSRLFALEFKNSLDCALPFLLPQYGIIKAILNFKPDVVHCVEHSPAATFCATIAFCMNIPIVWSSHTNLDYYIPLYIKSFMAPFSLLIYQKLRSTFLNLADINLSVSSDFAKILTQKGIKKKVHVWKTGVDAKLFNPAFRSLEMRTRMFNGYYSSNKILLVSVGRLSPEKKFEFLIEILKEFPQAFLCVVGGGPYVEHLKPLFPPDQAYFIGFLQGTELASAYASADYFVYASVSETFGQVYLEAMSSGIPIVAAEGKQMKEFFKQGIHGYTWKPNNVNEACQALQKAINKREILAHNCRQNALNHSWNSAADQIENIYLKLKNNKKKSFNLKGIPCFIKWLFWQIMVLLFMVPFMNVTKPVNKSSRIKLNPISSFKFYLSLISVIVFLGIFISVC